MTGESLRPWLPDVRPCFKAGGGESGILPELQQVDRQGDGWRGGIAALSAHSFHW